MVRFVWSKYYTNKQNLTCDCNITSERNDVHISIHVWVFLTTFKQLHNLLEKLGECKYIFMNILELAE